MRTQLYLAECCRLQRRSEAALVHLHAAVRLDLAHAVFNNLDLAACALAACAHCLRLRRPLQV
eukprot:3854115-Pyramimonas_sp.AAC.1